jgi:hypothetical protein
MLLLLFVFVRIGVIRSIIVVLLFVCVKQTTFICLKGLISPFSEQDHIIKGLRSVHEHLFFDMSLKPM